MDAVGYPQSDVALYTYIMGSTRPTVSKNTHRIYAKIHLEPGFRLPLEIGQAS